MVVGYALTCKLRLPAVANTIEEARYQARKHNRSRLLGTDIQAALLNYQIPSDAALQQAFETQGKTRSSSASDQSQVRLNELAVPLQWQCNGRVNVFYSFRFGRRPESG